MKLQLILLYDLFYRGTGPTGPQGDAGATPSLTIGTVTTGAPGSQATASISGTTPNFVLDLTIPQGPTGPAA